MIHKLLTLGTVAGIFFAVSAVAYAEGNIPGHAMQQKGSYKVNQARPPIHPDMRCNARAADPGTPELPATRPGTTSDAQALELKPLLGK